MRGIPTTRTPPRSVVSTFPGSIESEGTGRSAKGSGTGSRFAFKGLDWPVVQAELPEIKALRGIKRLRFRKPVMPGDALIVTLKQANNRLTYEVACDKSIVSSGQLVVE